MTLVELIAVAMTESQLRQARATAMATTSAFLADSLNLLSNSWNDVNSS